jgi:hypothetical protein
VFKFSKFSKFLLFVPVCSACYSYSNADLTTLPNGSMVRARITSAEAERVAPLIGHETRTLNGLLISSSPDTLVIEVPSSSQAITGGGVQTFHQRLSIARPSVQEVELKQLNRSRTFLAVGAGVALLGYVLIDALNLGSGSSGPPGGGGGGDFRPR